MEVDLIPDTSKTPYTSWRSGVAPFTPLTVDPVVRMPFRITPTERIASAGSCFAQHIARALVQEGFNYLVTEAFCDAPGTTDEGYGTFTARYGNLYTARQLNQLFDRAYGQFRPGCEWLPTADGAFVDPFRPRVQRRGFASPEDVLADRDRHLAAVRAMFETCDVFLFTLGLTEAWVSDADGSVLPFAPAQVCGSGSNGDFRFRNFRFAEVLADLTAFVRKLTVLNDRVRIVLTVSPVSLMATGEDRHVVVSTVASKSVLRAAVEELLPLFERVAYFPSFEIVCGPQARGQFLERDGRAVSPLGVLRVMTLFRQHVLEATGPTHDSRAGIASPGLSAADRIRMAGLAEVICDEDDLAGEAPPATRG